MKESLRDGCQSFLNTQKEEEYIHIQKTVWGMIGI